MQIMRGGGGVLAYYAMLKYAIASPGMFQEPAYYAYYYAPWFKAKRNSAKFRQLFSPLLLLPVMPE